MVIRYGTDGNVRRDRSFVARTALVVFLTGLLGYFALIAFDAVAVGMAFLITAELLALVLGWRASNASA